MKIYTKTGDWGETGTFGGRMSKADALAEALGAIDEVNSWIGCCRSDINSKFEILNPKQIQMFEKYLKKIQNNLFIIGTMVAGSKKYKFKAIEAIRLEKLIDRLDRDLPRLHNFIFPKNYFQVARAVARRCERRVVGCLNPKSEILNSKQISNPKQILKYLNRLSDALFVMGRWVEWKSGVVEEVWKG